MTKRAGLYAYKSTIDKAALAGLESQLELGQHNFRSAYRFYFTPQLNLASRTIQSQPSTQPSR